ncbi:hypothetical protein QE152_g30798 [Popillia japonica]|uniref:Uncharacterized protein n=1 Tax=Popillia japonica TaxID=7064 RepID=A0AAW1JD56_POPJA
MKKSKHILEICWLLNLNEEYLPPMKNISPEENYSIGINSKIESDSDEIDSEETAFDKNNDYFSTKDETKWLTILVPKMKPNGIKALILLLVNELIILFVTHLWRGPKKLQKYCL